MATKGVFYGVVVTLVALLLISSAFAVIYFNDYQLETSTNQTHVNELNLALSSYRSLSGLYNTSLSQDNKTLSLLVTAVANLNTSTPAYLKAATALSSLWATYQALIRVGGGKALVYDVHMLVDYGNGTRMWYNDSTAQPGWNGYVVTLVLLDGKVQATWYPQYGEHYVTGVGGANQTSSKSWFVWEFAGGKWVASQTGADQLQVVNGTVLAWALCGYDTSFNPTCTP